MEVSFRGVWAAALMLIRVLYDSLVLIMEGKEMALVSRLKKEEEWRREFFIFFLEFVISGFALIP